MRSLIKIAFTDFWHENSVDAVMSNPIYQLLSRYYALELSVQPDFLIYSCFGKKFLKYNCTRIFYTGENVRPNFSQCDYAFSFDFPVTERNYRLPLYLLYGYFNQLKNKGQNLQRPSDLKFCNFVYSNKQAPERISFFKRLELYKPIDSGGKVLNNIGGRVADKMEFLKKYKFTIAFENSSYPGYTTEKIMQAMIADTIPIYWGNPLIARDFNPECFINCHDFESFDDVVAHVAKVDNDEALFRKYITAPAFSNGADNEFINENNIKRQFEKIFSGSTRSFVASRHDRYKYWLNPFQVRDFATSSYRRWKHYRRPL